MMQFICCYARCDKEELFSNLILSLNGTVYKLMYILIYLIIHHEIGLTTQNDFREKFSISAIIIIITTCNQINTGIDKKEEENLSFFNNFFSWQDERHQVLTTNVFIDQVRKNILTQIKNISIVLLKNL